MYKIVKGSRYNNIKKVLLETNNVKDIINFFNDDNFNIKIESKNFDDILKDFSRQIEENEMYYISFYDYLNNYGDIKLVNPRYNDIRGLYNGFYVIVVLYDDKSGFSYLDICENNDQNIVHTIQFLLDYIDDYDLIIEY